MGELRAVSRELGHLRGAVRARRGGPFVGLLDDIPWDVVATDVGPKAVKSLGRGRGPARMARTLARVMSERRKKGRHMHKESAVEFATFISEFLKYAAPLPMGNFFARAAGVMPPKLLTSAERLAAKARTLSTPNRLALQNITTLGEKVQPPVWLR